MPGHNPDVIVRVSQPAGDVVRHMQDEGKGHKKRKYDEKD
jgi:hypothetical protein